MGPEQSSSGRADKHMHLNAFHIQYIDVYCILFDIINLSRPSWLNADD